jgi:hypothetical protein
MGVRNVPTLDNPRKNVREMPLPLNMAKSLLLVTMDPALHQDCSPGRLLLIVRKAKRARNGGQSRGRLLCTNLVDVILYGLLASGT